MKMEGGRGQTGSRRERKTFVLNETTPTVFVRVANAGLTGYGTWRRIRKMEGKDCHGDTETRRRGEQSGMAGMRSKIHDSW